MKKTVTIEIPVVGAADKDKKTSPVRGAYAKATCYYNGQQYSEGAVICADHRQLECWSDGTWFDKGAC